MKEEIIAEFMKTFSLFNRAKTFMQIQTYMKGENILLQKLYEIGGESTPSELTSQLEMTGPRVTAILRSLEFKKLVERTTSCNDKRKTQVRITEKGKSWVDNSSAETMTMLMSVVDKLGEDDTKELLRIMRKMLNVNEEKKPEEKAEEKLDEIKEEITAED